MDPKWIGVIVFMALMLILVNSAVSGVALVENSTYMSPLQKVTTYEQAWAQTDFGKLVSPKFHVDFFSALVQLLMFDSPVWNTGPLVIVKLLVTTVLGVIILAGLAFVFLGIFRSLF